MGCKFYVPWKTSRWEHWGPEVNAHQEGDRWEDTKQQWVPTPEWVDFHVDGSFVTSFWDLKMCVCKMGVNVDGGAETRS